MNREEIKQYLPHREPMLLLDDINLSEDGSAVAHYTVRGDEFFLQGHFPDFPVVPGVILCEMMAQSSFILMLGETAGKRTLYTGINNVKFKNPVRPGDTVTIKSSLVRARKPFYFLKGEVRVGESLCMQGEFSVALIPEEMAK